MTHIFFEPSIEPDLKDVTQAQLGAIEAELNVRALFVRPASGTAEVSRPSDNLDVQADYLFRGIVRGAL